MTKRKLPSPEQAAALHKYKVKYGYYWKSLLMKAWREGTDEQEPDGTLLRQIRNSFGPVWLQRY